MPLRAERTPLRRRAWCTVLALTAALLCLPLGLPLGLPLAQATGAAAQTATPVGPPTHVHRVVAASGVRQFIDCAGPLAPTADRSAPTVVLVSGLGASSAYWWKVRSALLPTSRVCVYDRPGLGASPARRAVRVVSAAWHAAELAGLLHAVGETRPLILVGHSYGGLIVRAFAIRYPTWVAGVMMLDACYANQWRGGGRYWPEPRARIDMKATEVFVWARPRLATKPLIVMTAGIGSSSNWISRQNALATMSANVEHVIVVASSHVIQLLRPLPVIVGIRQLVTAARTHAPLPHCATIAATWTHFGARCLR